MTTCTSVLIVSSLTLRTISGVFTIGLIFIRLSSLSIIGILASLLVIAYNRASIRLCIFLRTTLCIVPRTTLLISVAVWCVWI